MGTAITIVGGSGGAAVNFSFTSYGVNTTRFANNFSSTVSTLAATLVGPDSTQAAFGHALTPSGAAFDVLTPSSVDGGTGTYTLASGSYVLDTIGGGTAVNLAGGDTVLVAGENPHATINGGAGGNSVVFVDGNNTYNGTGDAGNDTVVAGTGFDTIITGTGNDVVASGTGDATIYLNDTGTTGGAFQEFAYLDDGTNTVYANGVGDVVVATASGQTVVGSAAATGADVLTVAIIGTGSASGNDLVNAGGAFTNVFDETSNNTINGGTNGLTFIAGAGITADVNIGAQTYAVLFGNAGDSITIGAESTTGGTAIFFAATGNETLDGAASNTNLTLYGGSDTGGSDSLVGGAGTNTFSAGAGSETLVGGTGANTYLFDATATAGASITIADLGASDQIYFDSSFSAATVAADIQAGSVSGGNFVVSFGSGGPTVTFDGVTSASQITSHIVSFGS
jgi:Ca2+-binding RTX toxin-like protein